MTPCLWHSSYFCLLVCVSKCGSLCQLAFNFFVAARLRNAPFLECSLFGPLSTNTGHISCTLKDSFSSSRSKLAHLCDGLANFGMRQHGQICHIFESSVSQSYALLYVCRRLVIKLSIETVRAMQRMLFCREFNQNDALVVRLTVLGVCVCLCVFRGYFPSRRQQHHRFLLLLHSFGA